METAERKENVSDKFTLFRTNYCNDITKEFLDKEVTVNGWVFRRRDHGGVIFIDLRDRTGLVQLVFNPENNKDTHAIAESLRSEFVVAAKGKVILRDKENINPDLNTGEIEIIVSEIEILNIAKPIPFQLEEYSDVSEEVRLKYRFLDLRRQKMMQNMFKRAAVCGVARNYLDKNGFIEVETPMLNKSTPEGARDFIVPSRIQTGSFYALPQSPQIFKQILMVAGFEKYYQIVKCFRDEDLRADRQPEFTQIDIEMSYINKEHLITEMEGMIQTILKEVYNIDAKLPFPRMQYSDAINKYGTDRPDLRFGMEIVDLDEVGATCNFNVFKKIIEDKGKVVAINAPGGKQLSRKDIDDLIGHTTKVLGGGGLAWMRVTEKGLESNIVKFFTEENQKTILKKADANPGDLLLFVADSAKKALDIAGALRLHVAKLLKIVPEDHNDLAFTWVVDFPLFEWNPEEKRYDSVHHPFTMPTPEHIHMLDSDPLAVKSESYDLVLNGYELGGGSIRIHNQELQKKIFRLLNISDEDAEEKFGFLLNALKYGAPPHGGLAFGLDRIMMILQNETSIRDVIAFPKTQRGQCLMSGAPSRVAPEQLLELGVTLRQKSTT